MVRGGVVSCARLFPAYVGELAGVPYPVHACCCRCWLVFVRRAIVGFLSATAVFTSVYMWFGWRWHALKDAWAAADAAAAADPPVCDGDGRR